MGQGVLVSYVMPGSPFTDESYAGTHVSSPTIVTE